MAYYFGSFQLDSVSGGLGIIFKSKDVSSPTVAPVTSNVARRAGSVKSGEIINARDIDVALKIVASSRTDLVTRLDALKKALRLRGQSLVIFEDGRLWNNVDCLAAEGKLTGGADVLACNLSLKFRAYDPILYAPTSSSYDTGTVALTSASGTWNFPAISVTGGGTSESFPLIRLTNKTSTGATTLTTARNVSTAYTTLPVNATSFSGAVGDKLQLSSGGNTQTVNVATAFSVAATTITVTSFTANATYPIGASVTKATQWDAISVTQTTDSQTISAYSTTAKPLPVNNAEYMDIQCDPATGMSMQSNGNGKLHDPVGVLVTLPPDITTFNISITSVSAVSAQAVFSWVSRYV